MSIAMSGDHEKPSRWCAVRVSLLLGIVAIVSNVFSPRNVLAQVAGDDNSGSPPRNSSLKSPGIRLPDGTYLWPGSEQNGVRVELTLEQWRKLLEQLEPSRQSPPGRKTVTPSECRLVAHVQKRGEANVAVIQAEYAFRTTQAGSWVALGGRKAYAARAVLDEKDTPILESSDEGLQVYVERPGNHQMTVVWETLVAALGPKGDVGFELSLPRAAITKLIFDPLPAKVKRVQLAMRTPDVDPSRPPIISRDTTVDAEQLSKSHGGRPLGAVEHLEVSWEMPTQLLSAPDDVRTAEWDVQFRISDTNLETQARLNLHGNARQWKVVIPPGANIVAERQQSGARFGPDPAPTLTQPETSKSLWIIDFGSATPSEWQFRIEWRQQRPKAPDAKTRVSYAVGPLIVLDVFRQTGTVKLTAPPTTRLVVKPSSTLRLMDASNPATEAETTLLYRLATGPTGGQPTPVPLVEVEARPLTGRLVIRPTYRLKLTEVGWRVAVDVRVTPIRTEVDQITLELPNGWSKLEPVSPVIDTILQANNDGSKSIATVRLANAFRDPVELTVSSLVSTQDYSRGAMSIFLPRFPQAPAAESHVQVEVPSELEVKGAAREWDSDKPSNWAIPLQASSGEDHNQKLWRVLTGKFEQGLAQLDLAWQRRQPELSAEILANVEIEERQILIEGELRLRSAESLPPEIICQGPERLIPSPAQAFPFLQSSDAPEKWELKLSRSRATADDGAIRTRFAYALPLSEDLMSAISRGAQHLDVHLFWPMAATRTDATLHVWLNPSCGPMKLDLNGTDWRFLPPEKVKDREILPTLTLFRSGAQKNLSLVIRAASEIPNFHGVLERVVMDVRGREGGAPLSCRALFWLRQWFASGVELEIPGLLPREQWSIRVDGQKVTGYQITPKDDGRFSFRVLLPQLPEKPRSTIIEVRYHLEGFSTPWEARKWDVPRIADAVSVGPTYWHLDLGDASVLLADPFLRSEHRWRWQRWLFRPVPNLSPSQLLDTSYANDASPLFPFGLGDERDDLNAESAVLVRQMEPQSIHFLRVPRLGLIAISGLSVLIMGLLITRLPSVVGGWVLLFSASLIGLFATIFPQPVAEAASAALPGLLILLSLGMMQWLLRIYHHYRMTHLPSFAPYWAESLATEAPRERLPAGDGASPLSSARNLVQGSSNLTPGSVPSILTGDSGLAHGHSGAGT